MNDTNLLIPCISYLPGRLFNFVSANYTMENKYKEGDIVNERVRPSQKLIVSRLMNKIYYCKIQENPDRKELVFFERELQSDINPRSTIESGFIRKIIR